MSERRKNELERDLESLRNVTDRDLPSIHHMARTLAAQAAVRIRRPVEEGFWMRSRRSLSARPGLSAAVAVVLVAVVLGIVPVSYERTVGHEVTLSLAAPAPAAPAIDRIATEFERALGAGDVRVTPGLGSGGATLAARVSGRSEKNVGRTATAFANALRAQGIAADARVTPRVQRVSSNLIARAMDRAIELRIERAGRSPAEIEADVRAQLEAAGLQNPQVRVTQDGDQTRVEIHSDSQDAAGERKIEVHLQATGDETLTPRLHPFHVERKPGMTDADVRAEIERQMREAGVQGDVSVENGKVEVKIRKEDCK